MLPARLPTPTTSPSSTATRKTLSGVSCAFGLNGRGNTYRAEREVIGLSARGFQAGEQRLCVFTVRFSDNNVIVCHACSPLDVFLAAMILLEKGRKHHDARLGAGRVCTPWHLGQPGGSMDRIVFFDVDGTLTRGVTSGAYLANLLGHGHTMEEAEAACARGEITNDDVCRIDAAGYVGRSASELFDMLEDMPLVDGITQAVDAIHAAGGEAHIASLAWGIVGEYLCKRFRFDGYVGSELEVENGVCTGGVAHALEGEGKCSYARELCEKRGVALASCMAIGDSRSDIPLFELVGTSIAFNATEEAERAATNAYRGGNIAEALACAL